VGKTKTAFVGGQTEEKISGKELYEQKKRQKEAKKKDTEKIHISGLKGGERIKMVSAEGPQVDTPTVTEEKEKAVVKGGPRVRGKNYKNSKAKIDPNKKYKLDEAIKLLKEISYTKFDGTVDMHLVVKKKGLSVQVTLPHSTGSNKRIEIADDKTIGKLSKGKIDFDILLATAEMMPKLVPFAKILGPKGLMPNPKNGTIIKDKSEKSAMKSAQSVYLKTQKDAPVMHAVVGKVSQKEEELSENARAVIDAVTAKQIEKAVITSTMSPGIKLAV